LRRTFGAWYSGATNSLKIDQTPESSRRRNIFSSIIRVDTVYLLGNCAAMNDLLKTKTTARDMNSDSDQMPFQGSQNLITMFSRLLPDQKEREEISESIAYPVILEIFSAAKAVHQSLAPAKGVSFDEFRILMRLQKAEQEGIFVIQENLVQELGLSPSRISTILSALDASLPLPKDQAKHVTSRPWIRRTDDPACRVQKLVSLTEEGKRVLSAARPGYRRQVCNAVETVGVGELLQLRAALNRLILALASPAAHTSAS
jgi:DNA-binding MarR family transcriptional regulator